MRLLRHALSKHRVHAELCGLAKHVRVCSGGGLFAVELVEAVRRGGARVAVGREHAAGLEDGGDEFCEQGRWDER